MATWTFHEYLREKANIHISWEHHQLNLPSRLPSVDHYLQVEPPDLIRFYQNPCLYGYTFAFWSWDQDWSSHLDWMAFNGLNLALASSGQEQIWLRTYESLGLSANFTQKYFTAKAFLPWNRMGNIRSWAGPLRPETMQQDVDLQHKILERMLSLGITPVVPAFNGIVPSEMMDLFPNEVFWPLRTWGHFSKEYSGLHYLMPNSELFRLIQKRFHHYYVEEYGEVSHFYAFDTFNEMSPPTGNLDFIQRYGRNTIDSLLDVDEKAVWVMQGWMFRNDSFWTYERAKALLEALPVSNTLVIDTASTSDEQFSRLDSYFGRPFVFCMLQNYGGINSLYGESEIINSLPYAARSEQSSLVGMGLTPEGLHNSYVMYELMMETFKRKAAIEDLSAWFADYSVRRYGFESFQLQRAWQVLGSSIYNCCSSLKPSPERPFRFHGKTTFTTFPHVDNIKNRDAKWFSVQDVFKAWTLMIFGASMKTHKSDALRYDVIEVTREALDLILDAQYDMILNKYKYNYTFDEEVDIFLAVGYDLEKLMGCDSNFLLGTWLQKAKDISQSDEELDQNEFSARNVISLWGPDGNILDYARRYYDGLIKVLLISIYELGTR